jgi:hypothetical protein
MPTPESSCCFPADTIWELGWEDRPPTVIGFDPVVNDVVACGCLDSPFPTSTIRRNNNNDALLSQTLCSLKHPNSLPLTWMTTFKLHTTLTLV